MRELIQNKARDILVFMTDSADRSLGKAGLTLTITSSKAGASFATITPTQTDLGNGWYKLALTAGHVDTRGDLAFHITGGSGADPSDFLCQVVLDIAGERMTFGATVGTGSDPTSIVLSTIEPALTFTANQLKDRVFLFDNDTATAALRGQVAQISASSASATPTLTVSTMVASPASGDKGRVV